MVILGFEKKFEKLFIVKYTGKNREKEFELLKTMNFLKNFLGFLKRASLMKIWTTLKEMFKIALCCVTYIRRHIKTYPYLMPIIRLRFVRLITAQLKN